MLYIFHSSKKVDFEKNNVEKVPSNGRNAEFKSKGRTEGQIQFEMSWGNGFPRHCQCLTNSNLTELYI